MSGGYIPFPTWLNPEIVPGLPLRWYGLMYLVAFYLTYRLLRVRMAERNLMVDRETVMNLFFWGIIGVLIGGRLISVIIYDPSGHYLRNPLQIVVPFVREGGKLRFVGLQGMAYHGGLLGAIVAVALYCRAKRMPVAEWMDMIATCTPLGYTFGRIGNFINGELFGRVTAVPWGVVFPDAPGFPAQELWAREMAERSGIEIGPEQVLVNLARHPSQLYEAALEGLVLFAVLWFVLRKRAPFPGVLFSAYLIGYGVVRFAVEYVRQPDPGLDFPIMLVQVANPSQMIAAQLQHGSDPVRDHDRRRHRGVPGVATAHRAGRLCAGRLCAGRFCAGRFCAHFGRSSQVEWVAPPSPRRGQALALIVRAASTRGCGLPVTAVWAILDLNQ
ncbi:Phosphatidylglycerol--prolipoprotein diacylglyceryl transferase [Geodia barretti]|uniref:Phosphatidylglycerol--prolipoprotein diacylglyceryl transferase n=1 Tax=Geodia barretti TaxID=519541 RepID=A0AA35R8Y3_GEOBA|nr:Phosphatidylglycerol--prolipoprotein diacylglyceryl transferase [Geodia barretti]